MSGWGSSRLSIRSWEGWWIEWGKGIKGVWISVGSRGGVGGCMVVFVRHGFTAVQLGFTGFQSPIFAFLRRLGSGSRKASLAGRSIQNDTEHRDLHENARGDRYNEQETSRKGLPSPPPLPLSRRPVHPSSLLPQTLDLP